MVVTLDTTPAERTYRAIFATIPRSEDYVIKEGGQTSSPPTWGTERYPDSPYYNRNSTIMYKTNPQLGLYKPCTLFLDFTPDYDLEEPGWCYWILSNSGRMMSTRTTDSDLYIRLNGRAVNLSATLTKPYWNERQRNRLAASLDNSNNMRVALNGHLIYDGISFFSLSPEPITFFLVGYSNTTAGTRGWIHRVAFFQSDLDASLGNASSLVKMTAFTEPQDNCIASLPLTSEYFEPSYTEWGNQLEDGNMEQPGWGDWAQISSPVLTKLSGGRPGTKGSQYGRVTSSGTAYAGIYSKILSQTNNYTMVHLTGWYRTSSGTGALIQTGSGRLRMTLPAVTEWTKFEYTLPTIASSYLYFRTISATAGEYVDWDDLEASPVRHAYRTLQGNYALGGQNTDVNYTPTKSTNRSGFTSGGIDPYGKVVFDSSIAPIIKDSSNGFSGAVIYRLETRPSNNQIIFATNTTTSQPGITIEYNNINPRINFTIVDADGNLQNWQTSALSFQFGKPCFIGWGASADGVYIMQDQIITMDNNPVVWIPGSADGNPAILSWVDNAPRTAQVEVNKFALFNAYKSPMELQDLRTTWLGQLNRP